MSLDYEFAPIDVDIISHPKAFAAGPEAMGLWLWGQAHCKLHRTSGRIARMAALGAFGGRRNIMLAKRLVDAGLWLAREDGDWDVWNYEEKAPKLGQSKGAKRTAEWRERERARLSLVTSPERHRDVTCDVSASTSMSHSVSSLPDLASEPDPEPPTGVRRVVGPDGDSGALFGAWTAGIREQTGVPQSGLSPADRRELVAMANTHAGGATGQALLDWARLTAIAFAKVHDPTFGGFVPLQARKWLDGGRRTRASPGRGIVQSADNRAWKLPGGEF